MWDARKVFDEMPERNSFTWATLISGYATGRVCGEPQSFLLLEGSTELALCIIGFRTSVIEGSTKLGFAIYRLEVSLQGTWQEHIHQSTDDQVCQGQKVSTLVHRVQ
ncbi:hypothetical protein Tco_1485960 [Tanacetum coccineum]